MSGWGNGSVILRKQLKWSKVITHTMQTISADTQNTIFQTQISIAIDIDSIISHIAHLTFGRISQMPGKELMWAANPFGATVNRDYGSPGPLGWREITLIARKS